MSAPEPILIGYRLFSTLFVAGQPEAIRLPSLKVRSLAPDYERLGYDMVVVGEPGPCVVVEVWRKRRDVL